MTKYSGCTRCTAGLGAGWLGQIRQPGPAAGSEGAGAGSVGRVLQLEHRAMRSPLRCSGCKDPTDAVPQHLGC